MVQPRPKITVAGVEQGRAAQEGTPQITYLRNSVQPVLLFSIDTVFLGASIVVSWLFGSFLAGRLNIEILTPGRQMGIYAAFGAFLLTFLAAAGSYNPSHRGSLARDCFRVIGITALVCMLLGFATFPLVPSHYGPVLVTLAWINSAFFLLIAKVVSRKVMESLGRRGLWCRRVIIVGDCQSADYAARKLGEAGALYRVLGLVELNDSPPDRSFYSGTPRLGAVGSLSQIVQAHTPCEVLICATAQQYASVGESIHGLIPHQTTVNLALNPLMGSVLLQGSASLKGNFPIVRIQAGPMSWQYDRLKHLLDVSLAAVALICFAPLMAVIAIAIKLESPGPVLFRQIRIGRWGHPFTMYKFRSMRSDSEDILAELLQHNEASGPMFKISRDPRITRIGRIVRRYSLDELPQLFNVLEGNMSLVGPRPPLPDEVEVYEPWQFRRLEAIPGMTGLWQVTRGSAISFDEMLQMDFAYMERWSLLLDVKILLKTVPTVVGARGAY